MAPFHLVLSPLSHGVGTANKKNNSVMKKKMAFLMAFLMLNFSVFAGNPLTRGTSLSVRIVSAVSSKSDGNTTSAIVENDVKDRDGNILIKRGTPVQLQVDRKGARGCGKPGYVNVKCISTSAVDGQYVSLEGNVDSEGENRVGLAVGLGVGTGLTILPFVGFAFLAIKGEQAVIQPNTVIHNVFVMSDYEISE